MNDTGVVNLLSLSGGVLVLLAVMLSVVLAVIIERGWFFASVSRASAADLQGEPEARRQSLTEYAERRAGTPEGEYARFALGQLDTPPEILAQTLEQRILNVLPTLDRRLWLLDSSITLAPLFGLLGSIIGMVHTFNLLGSRATDAPSATVGIANALISTGAGLLVAIIAVIGLNLFNNRVREIVRRLDSIKLAALAIAQAEQHRSGGLRKPQVIEGAGRAQAGGGKSA